MRQAAFVAFVLGLVGCGSGESVSPLQSTASVVSSVATALPTPTTTAVASTSTTLPIQQGRTMTATPRTGLYGGRVVTAHGEGWPPDMQVGVAQCAPARFPAEIGECATFRSVIVKSDASGGWDARIHVDRAMVVSGQRIDCAISRCTLSASAVVDGVAATRAPGSGVPDYLAVGEVVLEFDPAAVPVPTLPPLQPQPVAFDLDGDTRPDQLWMEGPSGQAQLLARLATGLESRLPSFGATSRVHVRRVNGVALIFYDFSGATVLNARFATFIDGQLRVPVSEDADHEETTVLWNAHSMCCPEATADTACLVLDGRETLVRTSSELIDRAGKAVDTATYRSDGDYQRHWIRRALVIDGARLVTIRDDSGVIARGAPAPPGVPLDDEFAC